MLPHSDVMIINEEYKVNTVKEAITTDATQAAVTDKQGSVIIDATKSVTTDSQEVVGTLLR